MRNRFTKEKRCTNVGKALVTINLTGSAIYSNILSGFMKLEVKSKGLPKVQKVINREMKR